jgi:predicted RNA-binding Zn-ribbon protein involved in translation (DUF1610 family)
MWNGRKLFKIEDRQEYIEKLKRIYRVWEKNDFQGKWIEEFKNSWGQCTLIWRFVELLKAKKELSEEEYARKQTYILDEFERVQKVTRRLFLTMEAEEEAFLRAGINEGRVEYICPLCGGTAIAVRHIHGGRYHGLGSGCKSCGAWHT